MDYDDENTGVQIVRRALQMPLRGIVGNAGLDGGVVQQQVLAEQKAQNNPNIGYDVMSGQLVDMIKAGIIDPAKVTKGALQNAASIAAMMLTTEALITDIPEEKAPAAPPMPDY
jgi:chaperonin GroEL